MDLWLKQVGLLTFTHVNFVKGNVLCLSGDISEDVVKLLYETAERIEESFSVLQVWDILTPRSKVGQR